MKLLNKTTVIFGLRGSGKTTFAEYLADSDTYTAIVYDTVKEYPINKKFDVYRPVNPYSIGELVTFINAYIKDYPEKKTKKYNLCIIDEANRFAPGGGARLDPALVDLNDQLRHPPYELGVVWIARRPTQLHPDITGLADNVLCFLLTGKNDIQYLNDLKRTYGDAVEELPKYHAVLLKDGKMHYVNPIKIGGKHAGRITLAGAVRTDMRGD